MNQNNNCNNSNLINNQNEEMCRSLAGLAAYAIGIPNSHYKVLTLANTSVETPVSLNSNTSSKEETE